jgi:hypothetical protein
MGETKGHQTNTLLPLSGMQGSLEAYYILGLNGTRDLNWVGNWGLEGCLNFFFSFLHPIYISQNLAKSSY